VVAEGRIEVVQWFTPYLIRLFRDGEDIDGGVGVEDSNLQENAFYSRIRSTP